MENKIIQLLKQALGPFIAFHAVLGQICESAAAGLMLSRAISLSKMPEVEEADGWFYHTADQWEGETCLSRREQDTARNKLKEKGFMEEDLKGLPAKMHFRVCWEKLIETLESTSNKYGGKRQTSLAENLELVGRKAPNSIKEEVDAVSTSKKEEREEPLAQLAYPKPQKKEKPKPWERQRSQRTEFTPRVSTPIPQPTGPPPRPEGWGEFVKVYQEELDTLPRYRPEDGANFEVAKAELGGLAPVLELFHHWVFAKDSRELNKNDYAVRDFLDGGWRDVRHRLGKPVDGSMTEEETKAFYKKYTGTYPGEKTD